MTAVTYFVDRSLGSKVVVEALALQGANVLSHDAEFPANTQDVEWLERAGKEGWVVLTKDSAIRRNPHERQMYSDAGVRAFILTNQNLKGEDMANAFVAALPAMARMIEQHEAPFMFGVSREGKLARIEPGQTARRGKKNAVPATGKR